MSKEPKSLRAAQKAARAAIEDSKQATSSDTDDAAKKTGPHFLLRRFKMLEDGLWHPYEDSRKWICDPFHLQAETRDDAGHWGVHLTWRSRDGETQSEVFGRELLAGDCREIRLRLAAGGLTQSGDNWSRQKLVEYLNVIYSSRRARCVQRTGWHMADGRRVFVLPDLVIGLEAESVILQSSSRDFAPFNRKGDARSWRESIGRFCIGNTRLVMSVCIALAGPLLEIIGEDGFGINLKGGSRIGKTTALRVAASVWGGDSLSGASAFVQSWRATGNGVEVTATKFSDSLLVIDELGVGEAKETGNIVYMLTSGVGKSRATRDGGARAPARWRLCFLSSGEIGLDDKNAEAKLNTKAGQQIRLIDLRADAGAGYGVFEELHGDSSADKFVDALRQACRENFGTIGIAWVEWIIKKTEVDPEFAATIEEKIDGFALDWLKAFPDAGAQVRNVAGRFALLAAAGEMASSAFITGWPAGEAAAALKVLFESWLSERGWTGASEDMQAQQQLKEFISRHGSSRFEPWRRPTLRRDDDGEMIQDEAPVDERNKTVNSAGWKRLEGEGENKGFYYYLTDTGLRDALAGLDFQPAVKALRRAGMILKDGDGRTQVSRKPPGHEKSIRLYRVPGFIVGGTEDIAGE